MAAAAVGAVKLVKGAETVVAAAASGFAVGFGDVAAKMGFSVVDDGLLMPSRADIGEIVKSVSS